MKIGYINAAKPNWVDGTRRECSTTYRQQSKRFATNSSHTFACQTTAWQSRWLWLCLWLCLLSLTFRFGSTKHPNCFVPTMNFYWTSILFIQSMPVFIIWLLVSTYVSHWIDFLFTLKCHITHCFPSCTCLDLRKTVFHSQNAMLDRLKWHFAKPFNWIASMKQYTYHIPNDKLDFCVMFLSFNCVTIMTTVDDTIASPTETHFGVECTNERADFQEWNKNRSLSVGIYRRLYDDDPWLYTQLLRLCVYLSRFRLRHNTLEPRFCDIVICYYKLERVLSTQWDRPSYWIPYSKRFRQWKLLEPI